MRRYLSNILFACAATCCVLLADPVFSQTLNQEHDSSGSEQGNSPERESETMAAITFALPSVTPIPQTNPYAAYDALGIKGWDTPFPSVGDTILRDNFGIRKELADHGIGFILMSLNSGMYNVAGDNLPNSPQRYNGQRPTYNMGANSLFMTYDLGRVGLNDGQLFFSAISLRNGFEEANGPRTNRIGNLGWYQKFLDGKVETKVGYFDNLNEYAGVSVAGSIGSGTLGVQSLTLVQAGMGVFGISQPGMNVRLNFDNGYYTKFGVQRSLPPSGIVEEFDHNSSGLKFSVPGAKALYVDEFGMNRPAMPGQKQTWVRGGGVYNTTEYQNFATGGKSENWATYVAADRQITQPDSALPFRGVYVGATYNYAPPEENFFSRYYEGRIYGIGLLNERPLDLASFVVSYNGLSHDVLSAVVPPGQEHADYNLSFVASYAYRLYPGVYVQPGIGYVRNPSFFPEVDKAVNLHLGLTFFL